MGIKEFLPSVEDVIKVIDMKTLAGKKIGVDGNVLAHRSLTAAPVESFFHMNYTKNVAYFMQTIYQLIRVGAEPNVAFDGSYPPLKSDTAVKRSEYKTKIRESFINAKGLHDYTVKPIEKKTKVSQSQSTHLHPSVLAKKGVFQNEKKIKFGVEDKKKMAAAGRITPLLIKSIIEVLKKEKIKYVVSPYEADAQLAYMSSIDMIDAVYTVDSDIVVHGAESIIIRHNKDENKLPKYNYASELKYADLYKTKLFGGYDCHDRLLTACIMSGCDYIDRIYGFTLDKCASTVRKAPSLERLLDAIETSYTQIMSEISPTSKAYDLLVSRQDYKKSFCKALLLFKYQRVYDCNTKKLTYRTPLLEDIKRYSSVDYQPTHSFDSGVRMIIDDILDEYGEVEKWDFLGPMISDELAGKIAVGDINPKTYEPYTGYEEEVQRYYAWTIRKKEKAALRLKRNQQEENGLQIKRARKRNSKEVYETHDDEDNDMVEYDFGDSSDSSVAEEDQETNNEANSKDINARTGIRARSQNNKNGNNIKKRVLSKEHKTDSTKEEGVSEIGFVEDEFMKVGVTKKIISKVNNVKDLNKGKVFKQRIPKKRGTRDI
jgi:exonuclease-1